MTQEKALQALHSENERLGLYKDAYAQPEQEPVAWLCKPDENGLFGLPTSDKGCKDCFPVYRYSQRTWVGLTDDEMENTFIQCGGKWNGDYWEIEDADFHPFLRTIEAKLKELNT